MTADELKVAYDVFKQVQYDNKSGEDKYNHAIYNQNYIDHEYYIKFMSWIKQSYPDIWEAWRAVQDIENSANVPQVRIR